MSKQASGLFFYVFLFLCYNVLVIMVYVLIMTKGGKSNDENESK